MTWEIPWVIAGVDEVPLAVARTMAYVTTAGREGVVASSHLQVTQTSTPSGSIQVATGVLVANNKFNNAAFESYVGRNYSTTVTTSVPATGGTSRTDLIYAHITDPGQSGHYPTEPTVAAPIETRVITNVSPTITRLQDHPGYEKQSGLALARITRPANTTTVQTSHITDLRVLLETATSPLGQVTMFAGGTVPFGWLFCQGQEVSRSTYGPLYSIIGTSFGPGNGTTTFNLPDFRGRAPVGVGTGDASGATPHTLGQKKGKETHAFTAAEMPSHTHTMASAGAHSHSGNTDSANPGYYGVPTGLLDADGWRLTTSAGGYANRVLVAGDGFPSLNHVHGILSDGAHTHTINSAGSGTAASLMQPSTIVNFIIKAY